MSSIGSISAGLPIGAASWISSTTATSRTATPVPVRPDPTSAVPNSSTGISFQDLQKQIVAAVKDAVSKMDPNASPIDMRNTIQGAVDGVLRQNGIDPAQMKRGHHHHGGGLGAAGAAGIAGAAQGSSMQDQLLQLLGGGSAGDPDGDGDGPSSVPQGVMGIGANSPADPMSSVFGTSSTSDPLASPGSSSNADALSLLLQGFLKNSMPAGSLFTAMA